MKSNEFITENIFSRAQELSKQHNLNPGMVNFLIHMGQDCSEYLTEVGADVARMALYRGRKGKTEPVGVEQIRLQGRKPLGMEQGMKDDVNEYFTENFGEPFRDSALCTGSAMFAQAFGNVYTVFPVNGYKILWSPDVDDLNSAIRRLRWHSPKGSNPQIIPDLIPNKVQYRLGNIREAIKSDNEIMLRCEQYYTISQRTALEFDDAIKAIIQEVLNEK